MKVLVDYLVPYLNFEDYDANHATNTQQTLYLDVFVAIFDSIRRDILQDSRAKKEEEDLLKILLS
jgi:E3 ubiquitin-protein ligase UBR4